MKYQKPCSRGTRNLVMAQILFIIFCSNSGHFFSTTPEVVPVHNNISPRRIRQPYQSFSKGETPLSGHTMYHIKSTEKSTCHWGKNGSEQIERKNAHAPHGQKKLCTPRPICKITLLEVPRPHMDNHK